MIVDVSVVSNMVAMLFVVLLIGFGAKKLNWVTDVTSKQISNLLIKVAQPFLIISSLLKLDYSEERLLSGGIIFIIGVTVHGILSLFAFLATRPLKKDDKRKICEFALIFANCGFLGYPLMEAAMGPEGLFYASIYVLTFNIYAWTWGMFILGKGRDDVKIKPKNMILNFGTIPCLIGMVLYVVQLPVPDFMVSAMSSVGSVCTPLSVFLCGILLAKIPFKKMFTRISVYYVAILKLVIFPVIITLVAKLCGLSETMIYVSAIMTSLPTATNTAMFAEMYDIEPEYAAQTVGTSTALCVLTVPLVVFLAGLIVQL